MAEVIIDLNKSLSAKAFDEKELFFQKELKETIEKLKKITNVLSINRNLHANSKPWEKSAFHSHETLAILGPRGIGKTSFLLSLCRKIAEKEKNIYILPIIDPTIFEQTELFLVRIISSIHQEVEQKFRIIEENQEKLKENYLNSFKEVAENIRILLSNEHLKEFASEPEIFAMEALRDALSGARLAEKFYYFVKNALDILGKDYFLLPIDDIDMLFDRGKDILETIRKYLSIDKIIVVLSGELSLYHRLVKIMFYKKLEEVKDLETKEQMLRLVRGLTHQYLRKIIPHYNRISLAPINQKIWEQSIQIKIKKETKNNLISISDYFQKFLETFFMFDSFYLSQDKFWDYYKCPFILIIPSNSRVFINFLKFIDTLYEEDKNKIELYKELIETFLHLPKFLEWQKDLSLIPKGENFPLLSVFLLEAKEEIAENIWQLEPLYDPIEYEEKNQITLIVQAGVNLAYKLDKNKVLSSINRLFLPHKLLEDIGNLGEDKKRMIRERLAYDKSPYLLGYLSGVLLKGDLSCSYASGLIHLTKRRKRRSKYINTLVFMRRANNQNITFYGNWTWIKAFLQKAKVFDTTEEIKDEKTLQEKLERPVDLFPSVENWLARTDDKARFIFGIFSVLYYSKRAEWETHWFINFFSGIAHLEYLISKEVNQVYPLFIPLPYLQEQSSISEKYDSEIEEYQEEDQIELLKKFTTAFPVSFPEEWKNQWDNWIKEIEDLSPPPAFIFTRAINRLWENLVKIREELPYLKYAVGYILERWTLALFQALLVEENLFTTGKSINAKNIILGNGIFELEESELKKIIHNTSFTRWIMKCPVMLAIISPEIRNHIIRIVFDKEQEKTFPESFFQTEWHNIGGFDLNTVLCALTASPKSDITDEKFLKDLYEAIKNNYNKTKRRL